MVQRMGDADEQCSAIVQCWLQDRSDAKATASSLTCELQDKMGCWPPAAGLGVTLLKADGEVWLLLSHEIPSLSAGSPQATITVSDPGSRKGDHAVKPKGPITGFNFYSMASRQSVLQQYNGSVGAFLHDDLPVVIVNTLHFPRRSCPTMTSTSCLGTTGASCRRSRRRPTSRWRRKTGNGTLRYQCLACEVPALCL